MEKWRTWWGDEGVADIGEDRAVLANDAHAQLVGAPLDPKRDHCCDTPLDQAIPRSAAPEPANLMVKSVKRGAGGD